MALTPEDIVNKRFQPTKFREGYDQDEVDDFLDEVVVEFRRLVQENTELKAQLAQYETGATPAAPIFGGTDPLAPLTQDKDEAPAGTDAFSFNPQPVRAEPEPAVQAEPEPEPEPEPAYEAPTSFAAPVSAQPPQGSADHAVSGFGAVADVTPSAIDPAEESNNLLQLARRLHEEHVREGIQKRDALIAEGQATADRFVAEAEEKHRLEITRLEEEKVTLERQIQELREFEGEYRKTLKNFIQDQLTELTKTESGEVPLKLQTGSVTGPGEGI